MLIRTCSNGNRVRGIQIVGKPRSESEILKLAYAYEQATLTWQTLPSIIGSI